MNISSLIMTHKEECLWLISIIIQKLKIFIKIKRDYINEWMDAFDDAVYSTDFYANGIRYTELINVTSFTDFLIINELSKNSDGYKLSTYMHKDQE